MKDNEKGAKMAKELRKLFKKNIKHENYKDVLLNNQQLYHKMKTVRSQNHEIGSYEIKYPLVVLIIHNIY